MINPILFLINEHSNSKIAEYIYKNFNNINNLSIKKVAENSFVAESTVVRYFQKFGYKGYREFISQLKYAKTHEGEIDLDNFKSKNDLLENYYNRFIYAIESTYKSLNKTELVKSAEKILKAKKIIVYAEEGTQLVANILIFKLIKIGLNPIFCPNFNLIYSAAHYIDHECVAILISTSDNKKDVITLAQFLKSNKVPIIGIIKSYDTSLTKYLTYKIEINASHPYLEDATIFLRNCALFTIELLLITIFDKAEQDHNLKQNKA